jgi:hypothetical protein
VSKRISYDPDACARVDGMKRGLAVVAIFAALRRLVECMAAAPARLRRVS